MAADITIIDTTEALASFCATARGFDYVTLDTEFLRERTYFAKLCLIQMAIPSEATPNAVLIDPLAPGLSLDPLYELFRDTSVVKVFHAARQDLEIFWVDAKVFPEPLFDTQVAAMVCGFGEQVGYETLVRKIAKQSLDKSSRFTDWSRRPLSAAQQSYALADVTHLRQIYESLAKSLADTGRARWVAEELRILTDPKTYQTAPEDAWRRIKTRSRGPRFLAILRALAAFRERYAQENNIPRSRVAKDDALVELASTKPGSLEDLGRSRLLLREARRGAVAQGLLDAVAEGVACPKEDLPHQEAEPVRTPADPALADLLRVLLKTKTEREGVAAKLVATASELDAIAAGARDLPALQGWRSEVFGADALRLCNGEIALAARAGLIEIVPVPSDR